MVRRIDPQPWQIRASGHATRADVELGPCLARGSQREHRRDRGGVVEKAEPAAGQAKHLAQPIGRDLLELRRRGRGAPEHRLDVERGDEQLAKDAGHGGRGREVAEESWVVPVGDAGNDLGFEVAKNVA